MKFNRTRREFLKATGLGLAGLASGCATGLLSGTAGSKQNTSQRPNLIYIFADQLGTNHCGYGGSEKAVTPNIDRLAAQGADFRNAISTMPVCSAYRASLFTGKYPTSTGMVINELRMNPNHECFGHVLTRAGYETGYVGKWHLYANELGGHYNPENSFVPRGPYRLGFDGYWAAYGFHHEYFGTAYYHTESPEKIFYGADVYEPDAQTDMTIGFVRKAAQSDKPFAAFLSYGTPHDPWARNNVPEKYYEMFKDIAFPNPVNYDPENDPYADGWGMLDSGARQRLEEFRRIYYAMTANLDWNIGRLLDAVDRAGLGENTVVVFTSDHGEMFGAHGRRNKNIFYDEAARVPFLIRWPEKIKPDTLTHACLGTVDIMPTVLSLMGLSVPKDVEGTDLSHCALGQAGSEPQAAFLQNTGACAIWENGYEWRAVRDKRYTYAIYRIDRSELLFDNKNDPYQMNNLAKDPAHGDTLEGFRAMLAGKMVSMNDTFPESTWYRDNWTRDRIILRGAKG